jgi:hypothetical protein
MSVNDYRYSWDAYYPYQTANSNTFTTTAFPMHKDLVPKKETKSMFTITTDQYIDGRYQGTVRYEGKVVANTGLKKSEAAARRAAEEIKVQAVSKLFI